VWRGPFRPTAAFASVRSLFAEQQELLAGFQQLMSDLAASASSEAIRATLRADTTVRPALDAVQQRIEALHLEVRDEAGAVMADVTAVITYVDLLRDHVPSANVREQLREEGARQRIPMSGYALTLTPRRGARPL
jgi:hypothetical protein